MLLCIPSFTSIHQSFHVLSSGCEIQKLTDNIFSVKFCIFNAFDTELRAIEAS